MLNLEMCESHKSTSPASPGLKWRHGFDNGPDSSPSSARREWSDRMAFYMVRSDPSFVGLLHSGSLRTFLNRETSATESLSSAAQLKISDEKGSGRDHTVNAANVLHRSIEAVECLRNLEDGWADEDSIAPTEAAIGDAYHFLAKLPPGTPEPRVSAATDGEIVIEFKTAGLEAVVGIEGDGGFGYALLVDNKFVAGKYEGVLARDLPRDLSEYLSEMSK